MKTTKFLSRVTALAVIMFLSTGAANAQFGKLKNKLKSVKNKIENKVEDKAEQALREGSVKAENKAKGDPRFTRVAPEPGEFNPNTFYSSDIRPADHTGWDKNTPNGRLEEHVAFLLSQQIENLNNGDWDAVAADFKVRSNPMWLVYKELRDRGEDVLWMSDKILSLRKFQRHYLYPALHVCDRNGYSSQYTNGDFDWSTYSIAKHDFYDILKYYIEMAKKEPSKELKYTTTSEAIFWRGDGAMQPAKFKGNPLMADDPEWVEADKELTALCKEVGIKSLASFEAIEKYRKEVENAELLKKMKWNTENLIPKRSIDDPKAVAMATKEFNIRMNGAAVVDKVFVTTGWGIYRNSFGIAKSREKCMSIVAKYKDGTYRLHKCRLSSITSDNGSSWSNILFSIDAVSGNDVGYPIHWKDK